MALFTEKEQQDIADAIKQAEQNTSGEIVAVVAPQSDSYRTIALLWSAVIALTVPFFLLALPKIMGGQGFIWHVEVYYLTQLVVFIVLALVTQWRPIRMALVPGIVKKNHAHRNAVEQFLAQNLHTTDGRTGVLIFVSLAEHYAEIIADDGIYQKVGKETWPGLIRDLTQALGKQDAAQGFMSVIGQCGAILAEHFPPGEADPNQLPDHLIVLH